MSNHCIDVVCLNCGNYWCERFCGTSGKYSKVPEWITKKYPDFKPGDKRQGYFSDCNCGQSYVVME